MDDDFVLISPGPSAAQGHSPASRSLGHANSPNATATATGILTSTLIPGRGPPLKDHAIIAKNGKIVFVGPRKDLSTALSLPKHQHWQAKTAIEWRDVPVLMPGMWECHAHFMGGDPNRPINMENLAFTSPVMAGARNVRALKETLYAGLTSAVDLGGYAPELAKVVEEGTVLGPRLFGAGAALSMTAGHGDVFE